MERHEIKRVKIYDVEFSVERIGVLSEVRLVNRDWDVSGVGDTIELAAINLYSEIKLKYSSLLDRPDYEVNDMVWSIYNWLVEVVHANDKHIEVVAIK